MRFFPLTFRTMSCSTRSGSSERRQMLIHFDSQILAYFKVLIVW
uniref:Uncharacterized protein n=1 Tax=Arundo donax TaxID=35708 RepID=A0A0A8XVA3_ARUDO